MPEFASSPDAVTVTGPQGVRTTVTDSQGRFTIRDLTPGRYQVKADAANFATVIQTEVEVQLEGGASGSAIVPR